MDAVTRWRDSVAGVDPYGNPIPGVEVSSVLPPARFAPRDVLPPVEAGRDPVVVQPSLYWRGLWPDVLPSDRLEVRGVKYDVLGSPADWRGDSVGGLVVKLRDVTEGAE